MSYLHCPRCRLAINSRAHYLTLTNCPRCLARAAIAVPLFSSPLNALELHAVAAVAVPGRSDEPEPALNNRQWRPASSSSFDDTTATSSRIGSPPGAEADHAASPH